MENKVDFKQVFNNLANLLEKGNKEGAFTLQEAAVAFNNLAQLQQKLFGETVNPDTTHDEEPEPKKSKK